MKMRIQLLARRTISAAFRIYGEFIRSVPLSDYDSLEPWINRVRVGEQQVLTNGAVTHLIPTSGSTGARKLIPFTAGLQREFNAAIGPWLIDLTRQFPSLIGGRAYWSITPALGDRKMEESAVPIGFDADTAYLGAAREKLASAVMAVPAHLGKITSLEEFRYQTLLALVRCRDLRLISVWHPSFLTLLLDELPRIWRRLLDGAKSVRHLRRTDPQRPCRNFWPNLRVISCWARWRGLSCAHRFERRAVFPMCVNPTQGIVGHRGIRDPSVSGPSALWP